MLTLTLSPNRYLVTHHPPEKIAANEKTKPNLLVWNVGDESLSVVASFVIPKFDEKICPLQVENVDFD